MDKKSVLVNIQKLSFSSDLSPVFALLEKYLDRIEFTKDYVGLRDFLFLAEKNAEESEFPFFACFDFSEKNAYEDDGMYNEVFYDIDEICSQIKRFFKTYNRTLYISIGFKESILTSEDMLYIHNLIEQKEIKDKNEGEYQLRKFPEWYEAKYPSEILQDAELVDLLEAIRKKEQSLTANLKEQLIVEVDKALDDNNRNLFMKLTNRLKKMM